MKKEYSKKAAKFLDSQNDDVFYRIKSAIDKLPKGDVTKIKGGKNTYRLRIGDYRVIFQRIENRLYIENIDKRGQVYKR